MDDEKKHKKVIFEMFGRDGFKGRWIYSQRHMRFAESDIPELFKKRPYQEQEQRPPEYMYRIDNDGIHIAIFYDGLPKRPA